MSPIQILHLEDSPLDAELIRIRLAKDGLKAAIRRVIGHDDYLEELRGERFDLILADFSLPGFDGMQALQYGQSFAPTTPFLFVSGAMGEEVAVETLRRGATDYILKHRLDRLATAVRRALAEASERAERKRMELALRESERMHRLTLDSIRGHAILTLDDSGRITSVNAGAFEVLGYREAELLGVDHAILYSPENIANGLPARDLNLARRRGLAEAETWQVRKGGGLFWGSNSLTLLRDEAGEHRGYTKIVRDMSERKQVEEALHEADRRKDEFLAMLAHELRNPLSAIQNAAHLVRHQEITPEKSVWAKNVILAQVKHLAHLVDDLLDVARITQGKIRLRLDEIDLAEVLKRSADVVGPTIERQEHDFTINIDERPAIIQGDATRLEQVFTNLLTNAAKYTNPGGQIRLELARAGASWVVRVVDNGVGIIPEMAARVFELFAQVDNSLDRAQGGLGIGLTISRSLVQLHGGSIAVESPGAGKGSTFTVRLPIADPVAHVDLPPAAPRPESGPRWSGRILIVDDNVATAHALADLLRLEGFTVTTAHDGPEAIRVGQEQAPEVILLDIGLPGMNGHEVAHHFRRDPATRAARIIAVSGYGLDQARPGTDEIHFDHQMVKPVDFDQLIGLIAYSGCGGERPDVPA